MQGLSRRNALGGSFLLLAGLAIVLPAKAAEPAPLAIKGYDPVAYFTDGTPTRGHPDIGYEWDDHRYQFATLEHRELFKADPTRFAPQFANFCAMSLSQGEIVVADPENWLISDGKLFLFGKREGPALFQANLAGNVVQANQNGSLIQQPGR
jgi:hypothetical protein